MASASGPRWPRVNLAGLAEAGRPAGGSGGGGHMKGIWLGLFHSAP